MKFYVKPAEVVDIEALFDLSQQFNLLNLPNDKRVIQEKVERSQASFRGELPIHEARYLFVGVDVEGQQLFGCSQIIAQKGTPESPNYSFQVIKKEKFSPDLSVGFIHQVLKLRVDSDGPTEIGGLVVNKNYRSLPEKLGRLMSLSRFMYMGLHSDKFKDYVLSEMAPPLTKEGRSEFWEALGRRFTGMPYEEADQLSQNNKEFIRSLFPEEDIYLCLLDAKARLVMGQVGEATRPALKMLKALGFEYIHEVDPFDGGPHLKVAKQDIRLLKESESFSVAKETVDNYQGQALVAAMGKGGFRAGNSAYKIQNDQVYLPPLTKELLRVGPSDPVYIYRT